MSAPTYLAWPTTTEVGALITALGVTPSSSISSDQKQTVIDAVAAEIVKETRRQWIADMANQTRYFNGSGTGQMEVDEFVSLDSVYIIGYHGAPNLQVATAYAVVENGVPMTKIQIVQGQPLAQGIYFDRFPEGRSNIQVSAKWGYGSTIPVDLWLACGQQAALRIIGYNSFSQKGFKKVIKSDVDQVEYDTATIGKLAAWADGFEDAIERYTRPHSKRFRQMRPRMV